MVSVYRCYRRCGGECSGGERSSTAVSRRRGMSHPVARMHACPAARSYRSVSGHGGVRVYPKHAGTHTMFEIRAPVSLNDHAEQAAARTAQKSLFHTVEHGYASVAAHQGFAAASSQRLLNTGVKRRSGRSQTPARSPWTVWDDARRSSASLWLATTGHKGRSSVSRRGRQSPGTWHERRIS
jgi:hypothetical protein